MTIQVDNALPPNVVEIGNEITQGVVDGLMSATPAPTSANPYATKTQLDGKLSLTGGTLTGNLILTKYINGIEEEVSPYTRTTTINGDGSISFNGDNSNDDHNFTLNQGGVYGSSGGDDHWSLNLNGVANGGNGNHDNWYLNATAVGRTDSNGADPWSFGYTGATFGDGTVQTTAATTPNLTGYLTKADNLASVTSTSTARTNLGLTSLATASFATTAESQAGTSTTTVVSPSTFLDAKYFSGGKSFVGIVWFNASSGAGAATNSQNGNARLNVAPTTVVGYAATSSIIANPNRGTSYSSGIDFTKRVVAGLRVARNVASPDSNSIWRFSIGKTAGTANVGDLSVRGLMIKVAGGGALQFLVHNGTSLTTVTSSYTPTNSVSYDVVMVSDAGNATLYVNGSSVATTTGSPVLVGSGSQLTFECENIAVITSSPQNICISDYYVQINL